MKKQLLTLACAWMLCTASMKAQITLDHIVDSFSLGQLFKPVQISPSETKYFFADFDANTFSLLNMDFTPFITNIPVPEPYADSLNYWFQVLYITRALFDCDSSNIEYAYTTPNTSNNAFRILRTDGTILFELDSANGPFCFGGNCGGGSDIFGPIRKTSAGTKLFLQTYTRGYQQIFIYTLCGELPMAVFDFSNFNETYAQSFLKVFPNPTGQKLTFQINLPDNVNDYELVILDSNGRVINRSGVNLGNEHSIDVSNLSNGSYYYSLVTKDKSYQSGKFLITK